MLKFQTRSHPTTTNAPTFNATKNKYSNGSTKMDGHKFNRKTQLG